LGRPKKRRNEVKKVLENLKPDDVGLQANLPPLSAYLNYKLKNKKKTSLDKLRER
jgi:hypothetical protein